MTELLVKNVPVNDQVKLEEVEKILEEIENNSNVNCRIVKN